MKIFGNFLYSGFSNLSINILALFQSLLPLDQLRNSFNKDIDELNFRFSESIGVWNIPSAASRSRIYSASSTSLETHSAHQRLEVLSGWNIGNLKFEKEFWKRVFKRVLKMSFEKEFWKRVLKMSFEKEFWKRVLKKSFEKEFWKWVLKMSFEKEFWKWVLKMSFEKEFWQPSNFSMFGFWIPDIYYNIYAFLNFVQGELNQYSSSGLKKYFWDKIPGLKTASKFTPKYLNHGAGSKSSSQIGWTS